MGGISSSRLMISREVLIFRSTISRASLASMTSITRSASYTSSRVDSKASINQGGRSSMKPTVSLMSTRLSTPSTVLDKGLRVLK